MKIVTIIPLESRTVADNLTYFTTKDTAKGDIVSILIRNKKSLGLVIDIEDASESKGGIKNMPFNLKKIIEVKGPSIFRKEFIESALDASKYFCSKGGIAIASLIPAVFKEKYDKILKYTNIEKTDGVKKDSEDTMEIRNERLLLQTSFEERISFYKTLIRESFAGKRSIFIVLPNEHDISDFRELLSKGIENFTISLHSGLSPKKVMENLESAITLAHPVLILGTAPFLCIPRYDFGTIVLEHESTNNYKMIHRPYFDLRTFVEIFSAKIRAKFILGDSLLSFETIGRKEIDNFGEIYPLSFRINPQIKIDILERASSMTSLQPREKEFKVLFDRSIEEISKNISSNKSTFIFSLRKGLATMTVCKDCNESLMCKNCSAPMVLYLSRDGKKRMYICNRCKVEMDSDTICQKCGSWNLVPLGIGTDTVFEEVKRVFAKEKNIKILKLDKESAKTRIGADKIMKEFEENPGSILIGTEMAFFYLKASVHTSIIASFDSLWSIPNFKMSEKIIQIISTLISQTENKLIIQTKNATDSAILAVERENLLPFVREELEDRKVLGYPPFKRFIKIKHMGEKEDALKAKEALMKTFQEYEPEIFSGFMAKQKGKYVTNALIKVDPKKWSLPEMSLGGTIDENLSQKLSILPPSFEISIDPEDLL